jgi:regulator of nonsense transcripts 1
MTNANGDEFIGRAQQAKGKTTTVQLHRGNLSGTVERVRIIGREELTGSERARDEFILLVLRGERSLDVPFICFLWFPSLKNLPNPKAITIDDMARYPSAARLNGSQREVIQAMLSDQNPLVIAHGEIECARNKRN